MTEAKPELARAGPWSEALRNHSTAPAKSRDCDDFDRKLGQLIANGAGKSTFFEAHLKSSGLRFLNAVHPEGETTLIAKHAAFQ
jgi:hypothetical protein